MAQAFALAVLVAILLALAVPLLVLATPFLVLWVIIRVIIRAMSGDPRPKHNDDSHETHLIQEIHHGLTGMEERITNLETILLQRERKSGSADQTRPPRDGG